MRNPLSEFSSTPFWAKTGAAPEDYHPLIAHSADVAAVMEALVQPPGVFHKRLVAVAGASQADPGALVTVLTYLAAIHDIGKAQNGFQDRGGPLAEDGRTPWVAGGHVRPLVDTVTARVHLGEWLHLLRGLPWDEEELPDMLLTAVCHHGRPWPDRMKFPRNRLGELWDRDPRTGREPLKHIRLIGNAARRWTGFPEAGWDHPPFQWTAALANLFAGLLVTADWIGSSRSIFDFDRSSEQDPDGYWESTRSRARDATRHIGLRPPHRTMSTTGGSLYREAFPQVFTEGVTPTPLQELLATIDLPAPGSRLVVESETGSGKTEAILALYARLRDAGRVEGLVFALPTRATASSILERLQKYLDSLQPGDPRPTLALAMGGAAVDPDRERTPLPSEGRRYDEAGGSGLRQWASENAKRFFAAEIVVGTVDQVLLAGLPVRHAHHRLGLLARHLLVVDELHSYDRYMTTILRSLVDLMCDTGGVTAFLSATLSSEALHRLTGEDDPTTLQQATEAEYPSVSVHSQATWTHYPAGKTHRSREVRWALGSLSDGLERAIEVASDGGRVCILRNTVREARETAATLSERAPALLWRPPGVDQGIPVHSRYIAPDRQTLDNCINEDFGKGSTTSGTILISTQIVEQSLDLDFDWMLTDLAPVDVLLQRVGRVHRHPRPTRPDAARHPMLFVHEPVDGLPPRPGYKGQSGWGTVYGEILDLELTRRTIERHPTIEIPQMSRALIEAVYHREARANFVATEPAWEAVERRETGEGIAEFIHGRQAALDFKQTYMNLADRFVDADEERIRTRIGDDRVSVALDPSVPAWYASGDSASEVALSARDVGRTGLDRQEELIARGVEATNDSPRFELGRLWLTYHRDGWRVDSR